MVPSKKKMERKGGSRRRPFCLVRVQKVWTTAINLLNENYAAVSWSFFRDCSKTPFGFAFSTIHSVPFNTWLYCHQVKTGSLHSTYTYRAITLQTEQTMAALFSSGLRAALQTEHFINFDQHSSLDLSHILFTWYAVKRNNSQIKLPLYI